MRVEYKLPERNDGSRILRLNYQGMSRIRVSDKLVATVRTDHQITAPNLKSERTWRHDQIRQRHH